MSHHMDDFYARLEQVVTSAHSVKLNKRLSAVLSSLTASEVGIMATVERSMSGYARSRYKVTDLENSDNEHLEIQSMINPLINASNEMKIEVEYAALVQVMQCLEYYVDSVFSEFDEASKDVLDIDLKNEIEELLKRWRSKPENDKPRSNIRSDISASVAAFHIVNKGESGFTSDIAADIIESWMIRNDLVHRSGYVGIKDLKKASNAGARIRNPDSRKKPIFQLKEYINQLSQHSNLNPDTKKRVRIYVGYDTIKNLINAVKSFSHAMDNFIMRNETLKELITFDTTELELYDFDFRVSDTMLQNHFDFLWTRTGMLFDVEFGEMGEAISLYISELDTLQDNEINKLDISGFEDEDNDDNASGSTV